MLLVGCGHWPLLRLWCEVLLLLLLLPVSLVGSLVYARLWPRRLIRLEPPLDPVGGPDGRGGHGLGVLLLWLLWLLIVPLQEVRTVWPRDSPPGVGVQVWRGRLVDLLLLVRVTMLWLW